MKNRTVFLVAAALIAATVVAPTSIEVSYATVKAGDFGSDMPCLLRPGHPTCPDPDPDTGQCPDGYNLNEDGNCFPEHNDGCPKGTESHDDDETGTCHRITGKDKQQENQIQEEESNDD